MADVVQPDPAETDWAEFKESNDQPEEIGEYISALANSAVLASSTYGYLLWGVRDDDHELVGTKFAPEAKKIGNENLENWLLRNLRLQVNFQFIPLEREGKRLVLLEIEAASHAPDSIQRGRVDPDSDRTRRSCETIRITRSDCGRPWRGPLSSRELPRIAFQMRMWCVSWIIRPTSI